MIDAMVSALIEAATKAGANRDALETAIRSIVTANMDRMKRELSDSLTLQGWTPPQRVSMDDIAHVLPKSLVTVNPKFEAGRLRDLGSGAIGLTGLDVMQLNQQDRKELDRILYKFDKAEDQDAIILKPGYRAQYDNGTLFEI